MKQLLYDVKGENIYEVLTLKYDSQILYQGYVDDLVTSITGDLELKLNYGEKTTYPVIARRYGEKILWLPSMPLKEAYNYIPMVYSLDQFANLWRKLKYDPREDLEIIKNANLLDLKEMWLMPGRGSDFLQDMPELIRSVKKNIIAFATESAHYQETFFNLLESEWPTSILQHQKIVESDETWQSIKIYLDDGKYDEWDALRIDSNNKRYIHLGNGFCIPLE